MLQESKIYNPCMHHYNEDPSKQPRPRGLPTHRSQTPHSSNPIYKFYTTPHCTRSHILCWPPGILTPTLKYISGSLQRCVCCHPSQMHPPCCGIHRSSQHWVCRCLGVWAAAMLAWGAHAAGPCWGIPCACRTLLACGCAFEHTWRTHNLVPYIMQHDTILRYSLLRRLPP